MPFLPATTADNVLANLINGPLALALTLLATLVRAGPADARERAEDRQHVLDEGPVLVLPARDVLERDGAQPAFANSS